MSLKSHKTCYSEILLYEIFKYNKVLQSEKILNLLFDPHIVKGHFLNSVLNTVKPRLKIYLQSVCINSPQQKSEHISEALQICNTWFVDYPCTFP